VEVGGTVTFAARHLDHTGCWSGSDM